MDLVRYHVSKTYSCLIPYIEFANWETQVNSDSSIRFSPSENVAIKFETPPSIDIIDYDKNIKEIEYKEKSIQIERKLALKSLESSKIKLDSAIAALEATNTTYDFSKKRFDANLISYTEYLTELTKKQDANYRVILAKNDIELKKANLAFALGIDLLTLIKE
jgi:hypothetical protein